MNQEKILNKLKSTLSGYSNLYGDEIKLETRIREDLGITGDDVDDLLHELSELFGVNWDGFNFHEYFEEEPHLMSLVFKWYYRKKWGPLRPITVNHLIKVIEQKTWFAPQ